ncbi:uncharacterized protein TrAtP1_006394 [Trichoderma atroviride]|nr:hypothetical protein TrAtP1_006394 [Trichoderma atroviride]
MSPTPSTAQQPISGRNGSPCPQSQFDDDPAPDQFHSALIGSWPQPASQQSPSALAIPAVALGGFAFFFLGSLWTRPADGRRPAIGTS